jgi:hypothetical protein
MISPADPFDHETDALPQAGRPGGQALATPRMEIAALKEGNARLAVRRREVERENAWLKQQLRDARALAAVRLVALEGIERDRVEPGEVVRAAMGGA